MYDVCIKGSVEHTVSHVTGSTYLLVSSQLIDA